MQRIKLFENFSTEEYEINKVYENWFNNNQDLISELYSINEAGENNNGGEPIDQEQERDWLDDDTLSSGEMAALERDLQVISKPQLAALYLKALGQHEFGDPERLRGRRRRDELVREDVYVTRIPGIEYFCSEDFSTGNLFIGPSALSDAIGMESLGTTTRTINKFRLLLDGEFGGRYDEVVYKKIIEAFDYLRRQNLDAIQNIAAECIQDPDTSTRHRSVLTASGVSKSDSLIIGKSILSLFKDYFANPFFKKDVCKIQKIAIDKISQARRMPVEDLVNYYKNYLIDQKMLNKFYWCDLYKKSDYGVY